MITFKSLTLAIILMGSLIPLEAQTEKTSITLPGGIPGNKPAEAQGTLASADRVPHRAAKGVMDPQSAFGSLQVTTVVRSSIQLSAEVAPGDSRVASGNQEASIAAPDFNWDLSDLFIQDSTAGIFVDPGQTKLALHHGEFVKVKGFSGIGDLAPEIDRAHFRSLGQAPMPNTHRPTSDELASGRLDLQWIELEGIVRSVAERDGGLVLNVPSGAFECRVFVLKYPSVHTDIVDSRVRIRGVFAGLYDPSSVGVIGFQVLTPRWSDVKVLARRPQGLWSVPGRPIRWPLRLTLEGGFAHRVPVHGVVTYQQLGRFLCLRDSGGALLVNSTQPTSLRVGDLIDATGYPDIGACTVVMRDAILPRVGAGPAPRSVEVSPEELRAGRHDAELLDLSARLLNCTTRLGEDVLESQAGQVTFRAVLETAKSSLPLGSLRAGSRLQLARVSKIDVDENHQANGFEILLHSPADVVVRELPSWLTPRRALLALELLAVAVILALGWIGALRRRVRQVTGALRLKYEHELALEEEYRDLFENANDLIQWVDPQARFLYVNPAWRKTLGYGEEEVANLSVFDIVQPNQRENCRQLFQRMMSGEKIERVDIEFVTKGGETVALEGSSHCQFADGKPGSCLSIFRNVTERKRAEEALRQSERVNWEVISNPQEGVIVYDQEFRYLAWDRFMEELTGVPATQVLGKSALSLFPHLRERNVEPLLRRALAGETVQSHDVAFPVRETAKSGWVSTTYSPYVGAKGEIVGVVGIVREITKRKVAEKALRDAEEKFRKAFDSCPEPMGIRTFPEGRLLEINDAFVRASGYSRKEVIGKTVKEVGIWASTEDWDRTNELIARNGRVRDLEVDLRSKAGKLVHALLSSERIDLDGISCVLFVARDITERKRADDALRESEARLKVIFDSVQTGIFIIDPETHRIVDANPVALQTVGATRDQVVAAQCHNFICPAEEGFCPVTDLGQAVDNSERVLLTANGEKRAVLKNVVSVSIAGRKHLLESFIDITERKRAEEALRDSEENYRTLIELASDAIFITDANFRLLDFNASACALSGYSRDEILGKSILDFMLEEDLAATPIRMEELLTGRPLLSERRFRRKDSVIVPIEISNKRLPDGRFQGIVRDITERRRSEQEIRRLNRALRTMVACNRIVVGADSEQGLLKSVCKSLVEEGGYRMAWVGYTQDDEAKTVLPVAFAGFEEGYLSLIRVTWADEPLGKGPVGTAIRTGQPATARCAAPDASFSPWREEALKRGYGSVIGLPLRAASETLGVLALYASDPKAFDDAEVRLLSELAGDLGFGIETIRIRAERQRAEEALRRSESRFRRLAEANMLGITICDISGRFVYANEAYLNMTGYTREELEAGRVSWDIVTPPDQRHIPEAISKELETTGVCAPLETVHLHKEGWRVPVLIGLAKLEGHENQAISYVIDLTEHKKNEEKIRESEEKFRTAFMTGADALFIATLKEGIIFEVNARFQDVFGYAREEIIGKTSNQLGLYADPCDRLKMDSQLEKNGYVRNLELRGKRKSGEAIIVLLSANVLPGSGEPVVLGVVRDITEQKRVQESLVRLRQAVDASGEVIFMTDQHGVISFVNPQFTQLYGYTGAEVVGKVSPRILGSGTQPPEVYDNFWQTVLGKRVARGQLTHKAKDGRLVAVESSANPIRDEGGNITGYLVIQRDITERKHLEEQFIQAQKMEAIGRLAAGVAHDFNNLLTIINGHSSLMLKHLPSDDPARDAFAEIKDAGERAAGLTRQLLAFSRQQVHTSNVLDMNTLVSDSIKMLRRLIGEDIELLFNPVPDLGMVYADPGEIEQVLMNIAVNSRDAMPKGGKLTIELSNFRADQAYATSHYPMSPGVYVRLLVSDTGCGMDAETQARIFEPFFTTKGPGKGTGLGLATVYGIIKQCGGYIWVYSEVGHGTTFRIYLPVVEGEPEENEARAAMAGGSETVLLVEDEVKLRSLARRILESEGYRVLEAPTSMEALLIASRHTGPIHMLLTDVVMPVMSGRELAETLAKRRAEMKILYMSGYTDDTIVRHGVLKSEVAFLQKPFAPEALARKVREVLDA